MIIPVLDIKDGKAVSGQSGKRKTYKALKTVFHSSSDPIQIAVSLKKEGAEQIYIADLDAIEGRGSNGGIVKKINKVIPVMLDCGAYNLETVTEALEIADKVIVATETLKSGEELFKILKTLPKERLVVSVDFKDGKILSKTEIGCDELIEIFNEYLPNEVILLDISRVGTFKGINKGFISKFSGINSSIIIGGGIQGDDIPTVFDLGVDKVLVGSALHEGKLKL